MPAEDAVLRLLSRVVDDHPQPFAEAFEPSEDVGLVQVVGEHVERDRRVRDEVVEEREDQVVRLETEPVVDVRGLFRLREPETGVRGARDDRPADGVEVGPIGELVAEGLGRREPAREADVEESIVGDRRERDIEVDRGAAFELAVRRHVHGRASIDVLPSPRLEREVDPTELLERRLGRRVLAGPGDRCRDRLVVREGQPILQRLEPSCPGSAALDREADKIGRRGRGDVKPNQAHPFAAPELHREAGLGVRGLELAQSSLLAG